MRDEKFTPEDLREACEDLATVPYFPTESMNSVITYLARMCPHKRALRYVVDEVVNQVGKWPGLAELRGILCNRFDAADGIDRMCTLPGYRAEDNETRYLEQHNSFKEQKQLGNFSTDLRKLAASKSMLDSDGKVR